MTGHEKKNISDWFDLLNGLIPYGGVIELPVLSGSMMPLIMPGKNIKIRSVSGNNVRVGDVIVFKDGKSLTMHRVLARIPFGSFALLYQKGDASQFGSWIRHERVVGIVTAIQDDAGTYDDISHPAVKKKSKQEAFRQIILAAWNAALLIPRFMKKCLKER
jgi:signal peptidase I